MKKELKIEDFVIVKDTRSSRRDLISSCKKCYFYNNELEKVYGKCFKMESLNKVKNKHYYEISDNN